MILCLLSASCSTLQCRRDQICMQESGAAHCSCPKCLEPGHSVPSHSVPSSHLVPGHSGDLAVSGHLDPGHFGPVTGHLGPVCGYDEVTYKSHCAMKRHYCLTNNPQSPDVDYSHTCQSKCQIGIVGKAVANHAEVLGSISSTDVGKEPDHTIFSLVSDASV